VIDRAFWFYVLRCSDGSLYAGYTVDLNRRLATHQAGRGARYTRSRLPVALAGAWTFADAVSAMSAERRFKRLTRADKLRVLESICHDESFAGGIPARTGVPGTAIANSESTPATAEANRREI
jgi:putative endonuclease